MEDKELEYIPMTAEEKAKWMKILKPSCDQLVNKLNEIEAEYNEKHGIAAPSTHGD